MIADHLKELPLVAALQARYPDALESGNNRLGELTLQVSASRIVPVCAYFRHEQGYNRLSAVTAVDWAPQEPRFEVVYHLHSLPKNERLRLKCRVPESSAQIDSVTSVWRGADWYEREVWDMFGIRFGNHPDHRRILMPDDWEGHPLRKDYPVHGYKYSYQNE